MRKVRGGAKGPSVSGYSANRVGVLVMHFALYEAVAELVIDFGGCDLRPKLSRRIVRGVSHRKRRKNVLVREDIQRLASEPLNNFRHENDAEIGVDHLGARLILERFDEDAAEGVLFAGGRTPIFFERWQTRRVRH